MYKGKVSFNKYSKDNVLKGSKSITNKVPKPIKNDHILKNLSTLVCSVFGVDEIPINAKTGVSTPTIYKGDRKGEMFFKK